MLENKIPTLKDRCAEGSCGCYRLRGTEDQIIQVNESGFQINSPKRKEAGANVWYPLTRKPGWIPIEKFNDYELCPATEIERIRRERAGEK